MGRVFVETLGTRDSYPTGLEVIGRRAREVMEEQQRERLSRYEKAELKELRARVKRLEKEREILKKAAAFFARESDVTR